MDVGPASIIFKRIAFNSAIKLPLSRRKNYLVCRVKNALTKYHNVI